MQAVEIEIDITQEGHIQLSESLRSLYGRHARLILLFEENPETNNASAIDKLRGLKGMFRDNSQFDSAMQEIDKAWSAWQQ